MKYGVERQITFFNQFRHPWLHPTITNSLKVVEVDDTKYRETKAVVLMLKTKEALSAFQERFTISTSGFEACVGWKAYARDDVHLSSVCDDGDTTAGQSYNDAHRSATTASAAAAVTTRPTDPRKRISMGPVHGNKNGPESSSGGTYSGAAASNKRIAFDDGRTSDGVHKMLISAIKRAKKSVEEESLGRRQQIDAVIQDILVADRMLNGNEEKLHLRDRLAAAQEAILADFECELCNKQIEAVIRSFDEVVR